jgi:phosphoribosylanthranilate isomerase
MTRPATRIKICGITRMNDAAAVVESGAHALGLNFFGESARCLDAGSAARIADAVAGDVCVVGLFVNPEVDEVRRVLEQVRIDLLQFQGDETDGFCAGFGVPYMKGHRVRAPVDARALVEEYPHASWHLLDAFVPGQAGGTGAQFDWDYWPDTTGLAADMRFGLAGGLTPENVADAVRRLRPDAVDVCGGVEGPSRREKDAVRIQAFVDAVRLAEGG